MPAPTLPSSPSPPTFPATPLLTASPKDLAQLHDIHALLDRLFVRNRNQHRRNHWFKSLWQFRKELRLLLDAVEHPKKGWAAEQISARLRYWDEKCVHGWYLYVLLLFSSSSFLLAFYCTLGPHADGVVAGISRSSSPWARSPCWASRSWRP